MAPPLPGSLGNPSPGGAPTNSPVIAQASTRRRFNSRDDPASNGMFGGSGQPERGAGGAAASSGTAAAENTTSSQPNVVPIPPLPAGSVISMATPRAAQRGEE